MGCLNSKGNFSHWFGNIHLSGACNRSCYFCIGQHMMKLDPYDVLDKNPLDNIDLFIEKCKEKGIVEIYLTGSNTDPLLYNHVFALREKLIEGIPNLIFGIRTNGVLSEQREIALKLFDKGSITVCSFNKEINNKMMGGDPVNLEKILPFYSHFTELKLNIVLGEENTAGRDILETISVAESNGIRKINLREPYGQFNVGDPLMKRGISPSGYLYGMPYYKFGKTKVTYWDVHYVEVESVNLYANGIVSETYPITKGHDPEEGVVYAQSHFGRGRQVEQWLNNKKQTAI
jgi:hypothetical protein